MALHSTTEPPELKEQHEAHKARVKRLNPMPVLSVITSTAPAPELVPPRPPPLSEPDQPLDEIGRWFASYPKPNFRNHEVGRIARATANHFGLRSSDLTSPRRHQNIARPRMIVMYLARAADKGLAEIGCRLGGRDHTTVLHGIRVIECLVKNDWQVAYDVAQIEVKLVEGRMRSDWEYAYDMAQIELKLEQSA